jgi:hypothetical protein
MFATQPSGQHNRTTAADMVKNGQFSRLYPVSGVSEQFGGNRLTGALYPHKTTPADDTAIRKTEVAPASHSANARPGAKGIGATRDTQSKTYNEAKRPLAGSHTAGVSIHQQTAANSFKKIKAAQLTARDFTAHQTTTRRGGSSQTGILKPLAGTSDTFNVGGNGGRSSSTVKVIGEHYIGLHRVVVAAKPTPAPNRLQGRLVVHTSGPARMTTQTGGQVHHMGFALMGTQAGVVR